MVIPVVIGSCTAHRSIMGMYIQSTRENSLPARNGPPPFATASLSFVSSVSNALVASARSSSVALAFGYDMRTPLDNSAEHDSIIASACARSGVPSGGSKGGESGKRSSSSRMTSTDSQVTFSSASYLTAGTRVVGTISLYHSGLSRKSINSSRKGTPFTSSCSQTRSQKGHQPFVSRYSVSTGAAASDDAGTADSSSSHAAAASAAASSSRFLSSDSCALFIAS